MIDLHRLSRSPLVAVVAALSAAATACVSPDDDAAGTQPVQLASFRTNPHVWSRRHYGPNRPTAMTIRSNPRGDLLVHSAFSGGDSGPLAGLEDVPVRHPMPPATYTGQAVALVTMFGLDGAPRWIREFPVESLAIGVAMDADGRSAVAGYVASSRSVGGPVLTWPKQNCRALLVAGYQADGTHAWSRAIATASGFYNPDSCNSEAAATAIATIPSGGYYALVKGPGWINVSNTSVLQWIKYWGPAILKLDASGSIVWHATAGLSTVESIAVDSTGDVVLLGTFEKAERQLAVRKLAAADGASRWLARFGDYQPKFPRSLAVDSDDSLYISGGFRGVLDIGNRLESLGKTDMFLAKLDAAGNAVWGRSHGDIEDQQAESVAVTDLGIVVTGAFSAGLNIGAEPLEAVAYDNSDAFVALFDRNGDALWRQQYGDADWQRGMAIAPAPGGLVVGGGSVRQIDLGGGVLSVPDSSWLPPLEEVFFGRLTLAE